MVDTEWLIWPLIIWFQYIILSLYFNLDILPSIDKYPLYLKEKRLWLRVLTYCQDHLLINICKISFSISCRCHDIETLSILLALCTEYPLSWQRTTNEELWCFICCWPKMLWNKPSVARAGSDLRSRDAHLVPLYWDNFLPPNVNIYTARQGPNSKATYHCDGVAWCCPRVWFWMNSV